MIKYLKNCISALNKHHFLLIKNADISDVIQ